MVRRLPYASHGPPLWTFRCFHQFESNQIGSGMRSCLRGCLERMEIFENKLFHVTKSAYNGTLGTPKSNASVADIPLAAELTKALRKHLRSKHFRNNPLGVLF